MKKPDDVENVPLAHIDVENVYLVVVTKRRPKLDAKRDLSA